MNGPIAQIVALTCHANAFLRGLPVPAIFPGNSTCQFCDWVKFVNVSKTLLGKARKTRVAENPNDWFQHLKAAGTLGVRLSCTLRNNPGISDRMSSAFVGGGGSWVMEECRDRAKSSVWLSRWQVWNQNAPECRIWRVEYGRVSEASPRPAGNANLESARNCFRSALQEIHGFSEKHGCGGFTACFGRAMETLDSDGAKRHGYHEDLVVEGVAPSLAEALLDAAQSAWVFGGMGSWNDLGFEGADQAEYDRVSQQLFTVLNETIQVAANASCVSRET
jgi:hypothetical protein